MYVSFLKFKCSLHKSVSQKYTFIQIPISKQVKHYIIRITSKYCSHQKSCKDSICVISYRGFRGSFRNSKKYVQTLLLTYEMISKLHMKSYTMSKYFYNAIKNTNSQVYDIRYSTPGCKLDGTTIVLLILSLCTHEHV